MSLVPLTFEEACVFVSRHHRHNAAPRGHKFSIGAAIGDEMIGVVMLGRPVSRMLQDGKTLEITRLCTDSIARPTGRMNRKGEPTFLNPCSFLYGAARRAAFALGWKKLITYIGKSEPGTSLIAAGFRIVAETDGRSWTTPSRPRVDNHEIQDRFRFEVDAT